MEGTTDDLEDGGSGGEVCGGGGRGGVSSASGHQGSVPRGDPKERSPWGNCNRLPFCYILFFCSILSLCQEPVSICNSLSV